MAKEHYFFMAKQSKNADEGYFSLAKKTQEAKRKYLSIAKQIQNSKESYLSIAKQALKAKLHYILMVNQAQNAEEDHLSLANETQEAKEKYLSIGAQAQSAAEALFYQIINAKKTKEDHLCMAEQAQGAKEKYLSVAEQTQSAANDLFDQIITAKSAAKAVYDQIRNSRNLEEASYKIAHKAVEDYFSFAKKYQKPKEDPLCNAKQAQEDIKDYFSIANQDQNLEEVFVSLNKIAHDLEEASYKIAHDLEEASYKIAHEAVEGYFSIANQYQKPKENLLCMAKQPQGLEELTHSVITARAPSSSCEKLAETKNIITLNRAFLLDELDPAPLARAFKRRGVNGFDKICFDANIERQQRVENFLSHLEVNPSHTGTFMEILEETNMTFVLNRLRNSQRAYSADNARELKRNIERTAPEIAGNLHFDAIRETFLERQVLPEITFEEIENRNEENDLQVADILQRVISAEQPRVLMTLVDVLFINGLDSIAEDILSFNPAHGRDRGNQ